MEWLNLRVTGRCTSICVFLRAWLIASFMSCSTAAMADQVPDLRLRATLDALPAAPDGVTGFSGLSLIVPLDHGFYFGGTVYSAAFGSAGGLFIGGYELGYRIDLSHGTALDAGVLIGGGGGATRVHGDGLLIRPRLALLGRIGGYEVSLGAAHYALSDSRVHHTAVELGVALPLGIALDPALAYPVQSPLHAALVFTHYSVRDSERTGGGPLGDFQLLGVDIELMDTAAGRVFMQTSGAVSGDAEGYAEWLAGLRWISSSGAVRPSMQIAFGAGGGGGANTGGGAIISAGLGVDVGSDDAGLGTRLTYTSSLNGDFSALAPAFNAHLGFDPDAGRFRLSPSILVIRESRDLRKQGQAGEDIGAFGAALDWRMSDRSYLTGKGYTALTGEAGGFQMGVVGLGLDILHRSRIAVFAETGIGAAGGAGINTDGGALAYATLGVAVPVSRAFAIAVSAGALSALGDGLDTVTFEFGVRTNRP